MISTGFPWSNATRKTEIVDVANGVNCSDLADFPLVIAGSVGVNLDGTPVVCGGKYSIQQYTAYFFDSDKCYRFKNGVWEEFASMKDQRSNTAGVMYNKKLHMFGGYGGGSSILQTSETINVDGEVSDGPDLPRTVHGHAMTAINDTVSILSGGVTNASWTSAKTWYYNHDTEAFTSGPDLLEGRRGHNSASNVDKVTKAKIAVVTGGWNGSVALDSTEMLINGQWQTGTLFHAESKNVLICSNSIFI